MDNDGQSIQIMTMHASKGLEFDIVFVLGAAAKTPREEDEPEEAEAEKLRQLYVALTRARLRLYIPLIAKKRMASQSPLDLFWRRSKLGADPQEIVEKLVVKNLHIGIETVAASGTVSSISSPSAALVLPKMPPLPESKRMVFSYSSLTQPDEHGSLMPIEDSLERSLHTLPRGSETGVIIHRIFERALLEDCDLPKIVSEELLLLAMQEWVDAVLKMVQTVISLPFVDGQTLRELAQRQTEVEFFFAEAPHFFKGFIDLVFLWNGSIYLVDWKTNWLGADDSSYSEDRLRQSMDEGDYWFQASLYADALQRAWPDAPFGGAFYLFLRGIHAPNHGVLFFQPQPLSLDRRIWKQ
jgi:exodeoxyribonuclease V beta subunit